MHASIFRFLFKTRSRRADLELRSSTRLVVNEPARLSSNCQQLPVILQDVSSGGACLRTHQRLHVGERIGLSMHFGFNQHYEVKAIIVYVLPGVGGAHARYGVSFVWRSIEERYRIHRFVTERANAGRSGARAPVLEAEHVILH